MAEKAQFANVIGQNLVTNEGVFPEPPVAGADLMDFANSLRQAITDAQVARLKWRELTLTQNAMVRTLENYLRQTANYVDNVSAGNAETIRLSGLGVRNPNAPVGPLPPLRDFIAAAGRNAGTAELKWAKVKKARTYVVQYAASVNLPSEFDNTTSVTRTKFVVTGLASATRYWFRAAALGAAGPSPWTNAVSVVTQ